jgi:hypothetical protein
VARATRHPELRAFPNRGNSGTNCRSLCCLCYLLFIHDRLVCHLANSQLPRGKHPDSRNPLWFFGFPEHSRLQFATFPDSTPPRAPSPKTSLHPPVQPSPPGEEPHQWGTKVAYSFFGIVRTIEKYNVFYRFRGHRARFFGCAYPARLPFLCGFRTVAAHKGAGPIRGTAGRDRRERLQPPGLDGSQSGGSVIRPGRN